MDGLVQRSRVGVCRPRKHFLEVDPRALALALPAAAFGIEDLPDIDAELRLEDPRAAIELVPEYVEAAVEVVRHADVVVADAGQQQDDRTPRAACVRGRRT